MATITFRNEIQKAALEKALQNAKSPAEIQKIIAKAYPQPRMSRRQRPSGDFMRESKVR